MIRTWSKNRFLFFCYKSICNCLIGRLLKTVCKKCLHLVAVHRQSTGKFAISSFLNICAKIGVTFNQTMFIWCNIFAWNFRISIDHHFISSMQKTIFKKVLPLNFGATEKKWAILKPFLNKKWLKKFVPHLFTHSNYSFSETTLHIEYSQKKLPCATVC